VGERSIYARTFSPKRAEDEETTYCYLDLNPKRAEDGEKLGTDREKLETESDEGKLETEPDEEKLEIRATIGQTYSPICQFIIGYPPELLEKFKDKEKQQERERIEKERGKERKKSKQPKEKAKHMFHKKK